MDELKHLIKNLGVDKVKKMHEERISHARTHPRNPFFIGVIIDSEQKLKQLKNQKL